MPSKATAHWSRSDVKFLEQNWNEMPDATIAARLGRTPKAINSKRLKMGLKPEHHRNAWRGKPIRSAFEVTAHLVDPLQRYQVLQQRYNEVRWCRDRALRAPDAPGSQRWHVTTQRLWAILVEIKEAMSFEVARMSR